MCSRARWRTVQERHLTAGDHRRHSRLRARRRYRRTETIRRAAAFFSRAPAEDSVEHEALRVALINAGAIEDAHRN